MMFLYREEEEKEQDIKIIVWEDFALECESFERLFFLYLPWAGSAKSSLVCSCVLGGGRGLHLFEFGLG